MADKQREESHVVIDETGAEAEKMVAGNGSCCTLMQAKEFITPPIILHVIVHFAV